MNKSVLALAAMASAIVSAPAFAAAASTTVHYGDLNLASQVGREMLNRRISNAAKSVCHIRSDDRSLPSRIEGRKCYDHAIRTTQPQVALALRSFLIASR